MEIVPFQVEWIPEAAQLFLRQFRALRHEVPVLSARMQDPARVAGELEALLAECPMLAARQQGELLGYLGWYLVENFRQNGYKGAYVPEWGHAAADQSALQVYRALYRVAAERWSEAGCRIHAISLLANDHAARQAWFWNGFGLAVVDAVRPMRPLGVPATTDLTVRKATRKDARELSRLDAEHRRYYTQAPVFMPDLPGFRPEEFAQFIERSKNSAWLALEHSRPVGFIRFDGYDFDGVAILAHENAAFINGAYIQPAYRGRGAGTALLEAALRDFADQGLACLTVNFESFNPDAASFWTKYFQPVCLSVLRVPENSLAA